MRTHGPVLLALAIAGCATTTATVRTSTIEAIRQYNSDTRRILLTAGMSNPLITPWNLDDMNQPQLTRALDEARRQRTTFAKALSDQQLDSASRLRELARFEIERLLVGAEISQIDAVRKREASLDALIHTDIGQLGLLQSELTVMRVPYEHSASQLPEFREALWRNVEDKSLETDRVRRLVELDRNLLRSELAALDRAKGEAHDAERPAWQQLREERALHLKLVELGPDALLTP